tara:strand:+ start:59 stop:472 length:414 start_codon:yes stop_codon:yes gene_type:complete
MDQRPPADEVRKVNPPPSLSVVPGLAFFIANTVSRWIPFAISSPLCANTCPVTGNGGFGQLGNFHCPKSGHAYVLGKRTLESCERTQSKAGRLMRPVMSLKYEYGHVPEGRGVRKWDDLDATSHGLEAPHILPLLCP